MRTTAGSAAAYPGQVPSLYAWLRRNPRLVDGALALLLIYPGGSRLLVTLPFTLGMVVPIVFRRTYPVAAFAAVIVVGALQVLLLRRPIGADLSVLIVLYTRRPGLRRRCGWPRCTTARA